MLDVYSTSGGSDVIASAADIATVAGVVFAVVASWIGVRSLRSQASSQKLESISATNVLWIEVGLLGSRPQVLSPSTLRIVQSIYVLLESSAGLPVRGGTLGTDPITRPLIAGVPFVLGGLLPFGIQDAQSAPDDERSYLDLQVARAVAFGYLRAVLRGDAQNLVEATPGEVITAREELAVIDRAMEEWVGKMNEIAELYELDVLDRHAFVGKRSVSLVQRSFAAEPYLLWRNSVKPGRWGLRLLGLGTAARSYQWDSLLQENAVGLSINPQGFGPSSSYPGLVASLGWAIGAGSTSDSALNRLIAYFRLRTRLGAPFSGAAKRRHMKLVSRMPNDATNGRVGVDGSLGWADIVIDSDLVEDGLKRLRKPEATAPMRTKRRAERRAAGGTTAVSS